MQTNQTVTSEMIERWIGTDNLSTDHFLDLLADIANGDYPAELFKSEVLDYLESLEG